MKEEFGKMSSILVVFDFDGTLVHENGRTENLSLLNDMKRKGIELAIASRNHKYQVIRELQRLGILVLFTSIMADFRPKSFQIRHILYDYKLSNRIFDYVYFVDDYQVNVERVIADLPEVTTIHFGKDVSSIEEFVAHIMEQ